MGNTVTNTAQSVEGVDDETHAHVSEIGVALIPSTTALATSMQEEDEELLKGARVTSATHYVRRGAGGRKVVLRRKDSPPVAICVEPWQRRVVYKKPTG